MYAHLLAPSVTLAFRGGNSKRLHIMQEEDWLDLYGGVHYISKDERRAVGRHLRNVIEPLVVSEAKFENFSWRTEQIT